MRNLLVLMAAANCSCRKITPPADYSSGHSATAAALRFGVRGFLGAVT
ncbi:MAG TPA: hypothetical protein VN176_15025 [Verrucomicrobiae bacterium]|nr:hypothetical protein [Verrucomicrobiae bacterium]